MKQHGWVALHAPPRGEQAFDGGAHRPSLHVPLLQQSESVEQLPPWAMHVSAHRNTWFASCTQTFEQH